jgi:hypothetical protein
VGKRSGLERRIFQVTTWQEQPAKKLAARTGDVLGQRFYVALRALCAAGVLIQGRRGYRLSDLQL